MYSFSELLGAMKVNLTKYVGGVTSRAEVEPMVYPASEENPAVCKDNRLRDMFTAPDRP